jgi:hypothetical protein
LFESAAVVGDWLVAGKGVVWKSLESFVGGREASHRGASAGVLGGMEGNTAKAMDVAEGGRGSKGLLGRA